MKRGTVTTLLHRIVTVAKHSDAAQLGFEDIANSSDSVRMCVLSVLSPLFLQTAHRTLPFEQMVHTLILAFGPVSDDMLLRRIARLSNSLTTIRRQLHCYIYCVTLCTSGFLVPKTQRPLRA